MNNTSPVNIGALYMDFLRKREESEKSVVPSEQNELLLEAVQKGHQIIEQLSLFGAGLHANFIAVQKKLAGLEATHGELLQQIDAQIGGLIGLHQAFLQFYGDEAAFCIQFEKMVRDRMLLDAGVDPNDQQAVMEFLIKAGKAQKLPPVDVSSN